MISVPFDTATSFRSGTRFGPQAIGPASALLRPRHPPLEVDVLGTLSIVDGGDVGMTLGNALRTTEQIAAALEPVVAAGIVPVVLDGDHSIVLAELRAHAAVPGPVALVVVPELANSGYVFRDAEEARALSEPAHGPTVSAWVELAREHDLVVVGGFCEENPEGRLHDSAVLIDGSRGAPSTAPVVRQPVTSAPQARDDLSLAADPMRRHGPSHEPACSTSRPSRGCQGVRAPAQVLVAHRDLLALELDVDGPWTNATAGAPVESSMVAVYGDNRAEIGVRSCTPGAFPGAKDGITEHMLVLASDATITGDDGSSMELRAGVSFVMADGWTGRWEGRHTLVKQHAICRTAPTDASA